MRQERGLVGEGALEECTAGSRVFRLMFQMHSDAEYSMTSLTLTQR